MKTWKLVSGILSLVFFLVVAFQSCAANIGTALQNNTSDNSGSSGILVAVLMVAGGIVSVVTRKGGRGGNIALIIIYGIAALSALTAGGIFKDLIVWGGWCLICAVMALIALIAGGKQKNE